MLGPAEADALGAELARLGGVLGRVRVRVDAQPAELVGPLQDRLEVVVDLRRDERDLAEHDTPRAAVDRDHVPLVQHVPGEVGRPRLHVDRQRLAARHARLAHPARDDRGVRRHPAVRGQHPLRVDEAVNVVGRRLPAHEDDGLARPPELLGAVRGEDDLPARCARGGVEAGGHDLDLGFRVDHRVQELVELRGVDPRHGLLARDQVLADHVDRGPERRRGGALRRSRLEQVEPVVLDRELEVLDVPVVLLEPPRRVDEPVVRVRERFAHAGERLWCADARDDVLALRVEQKLAEDPGRAGGRVARERDAGA